jgi:dynein heavy chain 2
LDEAGTLLSSSIRLNHVFRPITFLNAFRQETARQSGQALDSLILDCAWGEGATVEGAAVSIKVEGLLITGASFDGTSLQELQSDSPGLSPCPICKLAWVLNPKSQGNVVKVPCYLSSSREKLLCGLNVPCNGDIPSWILSGFALLLEQ